MTADMCEIVIVRHGQTVSNLSGVLQGQTDSPLDATGLAQARAAAARLASEHFDAAFSSDLGRAMDTAKAILKFHPGLALTPAKELREWNLGALQGRPYMELRQKHPEIMASFKTPGDAFTVPGGESLGELQQRVSAFLERIAQEYHGKRLLFVSHGGTTQRIFRHVVGPLARGNIQPLCANAGISVIQHLAAGWRLITWSETAHLANLTLHETLSY